MKEFDDLVDIISRLRKECPWDREQTHESLAKHLIEEAYELLDALAAMQTNPENHDILNEELGDLLLQILLHSKIAEENKYFSIVDVVTNLQEKLIKRHPHVFGDVELESAEDVEKQWEEIKKQETSDSIFDDIDQKLPSITKAFKTQRKAKKLDLTYTNYQEALQDLLSEVEELKQASNDDDKKYELGDVLFSLINVPYHQYYKYFYFSLRKYRYIHIYLLFSLIFPISLKGFYLSYI